MLKDRRVGIKIYMKHDKTDNTHHSYSPDADIIVTTHTHCEGLYPNRTDPYGSAVRIEFATNKTSGIKRTDTYKWHHERYLGCKREYIKNKQ